MEYRVETMGIATFEDHVPRPEYRLLFRYSRELAGMFRFTPQTDDRWSIPHLEILKMLSLKSKLPRWIPPRSIYSALPPRFREGRRIRRLKICGHHVEVSNQRIHVVSSEGGVAGQVRVADLSDAIVALEEMPDIPSTLYTRDARGNLLNIRTKVQEQWQIL